MLESILNILPFWLPILCIVLWGIQMLYWSVLYTRPAKASSEQTKQITEFPPISVIITSRNQGSSLKNNLQFILEQDYPEFEVIVVNDNSDDNTEDILVEYQQKYTNLYHTFTPDSTRYVSRKKLALTLGIRASKYEWLVFTDPQCTPKTNQWLRGLASHFDKHTDLVMGWVEYQTQKGYFAHKVQLDSTIQQMQSFGAALMGHPYTGSGMNLAYRKSFFQRSKGFTSHLELLRGEDDLFINQSATSSNTQVELNSQSTITIPVPYDVNVWKEEKVQHMATQHYLKGALPYIMKGESMTRFLFSATAIIGLVLSIMTQQWINTALFVFLIQLRIIFIKTIISKTCHAFKSPKFYLSLPWFLLIQPLNDLDFKLRWLFRRKDEFRRK